MLNMVAHLTTLITVADVMTVEKAGTAIVAHIAPDLN